MRAKNHSRIILWALLALLIAACGSGPPQVTPTIAPTRTQDATRIADEPTRTPIVIFTSTATSTPSPQPSATFTPLPTDTLAPTITLTFTPTVTDTPTATTTPTVTPIPSDTPPPSPTRLIQTDTPTPTQTVTPSPTPTTAPSLTPTLTATATATVTPSPTATITPDQGATADAQIAQTQAAASPTPQRATFTPVAIASPTNTLPPPTLNATPTFITATPSDGLVPTPDVAFTPVISTPVIATNAPTATATLVFTPTPFPQNLIPPTIAVQDRSDINVIAPAFNNNSATALIFGVGSGEFIFNGDAIAGGVRLFAVNPVDPTSFVRTDSNGFLTFRPIGGTETAIGTSPFFAGFSAPSAEENKNHVNGLAWSPDGRKFAFLIDPIRRGGQDYQNAGLWFWEQSTGRAFPLLRDCPADFYSSCQNVSNRPAGHWQSLGADWSPDSERVLVTLALPDEGRQALTIAPALLDENAANSAPPFIRWENGQWLDNERLLVSGRNPNGNSQVAIYNTASGAVERVLYDAAAQGVYIFDAVQRPDGQIVALGAAGDATQPFRLYRIGNNSATAISAAMGNRAPERSAWSRNYAEAVVIVDGQQIMVNTTTGALSQPTVSGQVQVGANLTTGQVTSSGGDDAPPAGVIAGSRYNAGQQIQHIGEIPRNMRQQPNLAAPQIDTVQAGEYVTILAGPYEADGYIWWDMANARSARGWVSVRTSDGVAFFNP